MQGAGPYAKVIKKVEDDIQEHIKKVNELAGIKESDTGLSVPSLWDLPADKQALQSEEPLQVSFALPCLFDTVSSTLGLLIVFLFMHIRKLYILSKIVL